MPVVRPFQTLFAFIRNHGPWWFWISFGFLVYNIIVWIPVSRKYVPFLDWTYYFPYYQVKQVGLYLYGSLFFVTLLSIFSKNSWLIRIISFISLFFYLLGYMLASINVD